MQSACNDGAIDAIPIAEEVTWRLTPGECLRYLAHDPFCGGMCCDVYPDVSEHKRSGKPCSRRLGIGYGSAQQRQRNDALSKLTDVIQNAAKAHLASFPVVPDAFFEAARSLLATDPKLVGLIQKARQGRRTESSTHKCPGDREHPSSPLLTAYTCP